jgi:hypothetical protein
MIRSADLPISQIPKFSPARRPKPNEKVDCNGWIEAQPGRLIFGSVAWPGGEKDKPQMTQINTDENQ